MLRKQHSSVLVCPFFPVNMDCDMGLGFTRNVPTGYRRNSESASIPFAVPMIFRVSLSEPEDVEDVALYVISPTPSNNVSPRFKGFVAAGTRGTPGTNAVKTNLCT